MPEDYYADAAAPEPESAPKKPEPEEGESDSQTAVLPKSVLGGKTFKPGEEVVLEIVQVNEDSVVVKYASEKGGEGEGYQEEAPAAPAPAGGGGGNPGGGMGGLMY